MQLFLIDLNVFIKKKMAVLLSSDLNEHVSRGIDHGDDDIILLYTHWSSVVIVLFRKMICILALQKQEKKN